MRGFSGPVISGPPAWALPILIVIWLLPRPDAVIRRLRIFS